MLLVKRILFLTIFSLAFVFTSRFVLAQESSGSSGGSSSIQIAPDFLPYPDQEPGFLGQDHKYSVVFRGNGEAVVSVKIIFTNKSESNLNEIRLRIPKVEPKEVSVYQIIKEKTCIRYPTPLYEPRVGNGVDTSRCLEYQEPNYYYDYYGNSRYQKAKGEVDIDTLRITLPTSVAPNKTGAFFVYFRTFGYAKKNTFGAYNYTIETLKAEDDIRNLSVGISTDSDLFLKGAKGEVEYRMQESTTKAIGTLGVGGAEASPALDTYVSQIGQGSIVKTASNLAPLESYSVTGSYAASRLSLYAKEFFTVGLILIIVFSLVFLVTRFVYKKLSQIKSPVDTKQSKSELKNPILAVVGSSFLASILVAGYSLAVFVLSSFIGRSGFIDYQYQAVFVLMIAAISFAIYIAALVVPALIISLRYGIGWGVACAVLTLFWLILYLIIAVVVIFLVSSGSGGPVYPLSREIPI